MRARIRGGASRGLSFAVDRGACVERLDFAQLVEQCPFEGHHRARTQACPCRGVSPHVGVSLVYAAAATFSVRAAA
jgi:hypothetical protein